MSDRRRTSSAGAWIIAGVILLLVLYVLSTGPYLWLCDHDYVPDPLRKRLVFVYSPIGSVLRKVAIVDQFFSWYISFWR